MPRGPVLYEKTSTHPSSLGHLEWAEVHTKEEQILRDKERLKDTETWVEECGYSLGDRQDLPTPMVGLSPLYESKMCLTAVNDS